MSSGLRFGAVLALLLAACAPQPARIEQAVPLAWPEPPDRARVAFVAAIARPEDAGIAKGVLGHLADFFLGARENRLVRPMAVIASGEVLFVADPGAKGIHRFDRARGRHDLVGLAGERGLPSPVGLALGPGGEVYVADSALAALFVIRPGSKVAEPIPHPPLAQPTGIAYDAAARRLLVVDTREHCIKVLGSDGALLATWGARGNGDGEFNFPTHLWRDRDGRVLVTDALNHRVQVLDGEGRFLRRFGQPGDAPGDFMRQKGVATDSFGHVYIVDALMGAIQVFAPGGQLLLALGDVGHERGEFWLPAGIFIAPDDTIYVADSFNRRVQVFRYVGGPT